MNIATRIDTAEDAQIAVDHGVDGIVVSNHGGRATETLRATIDCLPEVVEAEGEHPQRVTPASGSARGRPRDPTLWRSEHRLAVNDLVHFDRDGVGLIRRDRDMIHNLLVLAPRKFLLVRTD